MTNNLRDNERYVSLRGVDNAMKLAKFLLRNGYEVFVELWMTAISIVYTMQKQSIENQAMPRSIALVKKMQMQYIMLK